MILILILLILILDWVSRCDTNTNTSNTGLLVKVSVEARLLLSRLLTVQHNLRIKVVPGLKMLSLTLNLLKAVDAAACSWVTLKDSLPPVHFSGFQVRFFLRDAGLICPGGE